MRWWRGEGTGELPAAVTQAIAGSDLWTSWGRDGPGEVGPATPGVSSYPGKLGSRKPQRRGRAGGLLPFLGHLGFTPQRRRLRGGYDTRLLLSLVPAASSEMCSEAPASGREGGHRGQRQLITRWNQGGPKTPPPRPLASDRSWRRVRTQAVCSGAGPPSLSHGFQANQEPLRPLQPHHPVYLPPGGREGRGCTFALTRATERAEETLGAGSRGGGRGSSSLRLSSLFNYFECFCGWSPGNENRS